MNVLAGVSGTRSAGVSDLTTIVFSPVSFGMRNREEEEDEGRVMGHVLIRFCTLLVSIEQEEEQMIVILIG